MAEPDPDFWPHTLTRVIAHQALTTEEAAEAMRVIMSGEASPGQIGGFLMALRTKGETVDELEGLSQTALGFARPVEAATPVVDTCGTGGDRRRAQSLLRRSARTRGPGWPPFDSSTVSPLVRSAIRKPPI